MHLLRRLVVSLVVGAVGAPLFAAEPPKNEMVTMFLVLLKKGPAWGGAETSESKAIQEGHMANILALRKAKKLVLAGPMGDSGDIRGLFLFRVATIEEAKELTAADPAVKAGRLVAEVHPWWVDERVLPEAGMHCQSVPPPQE
jgi:uncharacterized protein